MGRQPKRRRVRPRRSPRPAVGGAADFLTIGWMVSALTTLACELLSLAAAVYVQFRPDDATAALFARYMLLVAAVVGLATLILTALVWKLRRDRPPLAIVAFALVVGASPLAVLLVAALL
jgi:hypothetical protein